MRVAWAHGAGRDDPRVHPAKTKVPVRLPVDELRRAGPEARGELRAPGVGQVGHLEDRRPRLQPRARWQVLVAQVEIDVQLVPGERPAIAMTGDEVDHPGVHERHLRESSVVAVNVGARPPAVADEAVLEVEDAFLQDLALALRRTAHDELHRPENGG